MWDSILELCTISFENWNSSQSRSSAVRICGLFQWWLHIMICSKQIALEFESTKLNTMHILTIIVGNHWFNIFICRMNCYLVLMSTMEIRDMSSWQFAMCELFYYWCKRYVAVCEGATAHSPPSPFICIHNEFHIWSFVALFAASNFWPWTHIHTRTHTLKCWRRLNNNSSFEKTHPIEHRCMVIFNIHSNKLCRQNSFVRIYK